MGENWSVIAVIFVDIFMFLLMTFAKKKKKKPNSAAVIMAEFVNGNPYFN